jgi:hypothetical protein
LPAPEYHFKSPLLGLEKSAGGYAGWYSPKTAGSRQITLHLPELEKDHFNILEVNGRPQAQFHTQDGVLQWTGESRPGRPLVWSVR